MTPQSHTATLKLYTWLNAMTVVKRVNVACFLTRILSEAKIRLVAAHNCDVHNSGLLSIPARNTLKYTPKRTCKIPLNRCHR